ncbi:MAG: hypothetical protein Q9217_002604 [Psora testacea]
MATPAPSRCRKLLFLDWDSTLTITSTLPLIASIQTYPGRHPKLSELTSAYCQDMKIHESVYRPRKDERTTIEQELTYLNSLTRVEKASIWRINDSGIFDGVKAEDIRRVADKCVGQGAVKLREGWEQCVSSVRMSQSEELRGEVCLISVAWSSVFIRACLEAAVKRDSTDATTLRNSGSDTHGSPPASKIKSEDIQIYANNTQACASGRLSGPWVDSHRLILTADDKLEIMRTFISQVGTKKTAMKPKTVYVGDSLTDLACLMEADIGICVRDKELSEEQKELDKTLQRLGVEVRWVCDYRRHNLESETTAESGAQGKLLWWARDFLEVVQSEILS